MEHDDKSTVVLHFIDRVHRVNVSLSFSDYLFFKVGHHISYLAVNDIHIHILVLVVYCRRIVSEYSPLFGVEKILLLRFPDLF